MTTKHTPGPWRTTRKLGYSGHAAAEYYIYAENTNDGRSLAVAHIKKSTVQPMEANARLIAAAPDLLAALQALLAVSSACSDEETEAVIYARAAIAKARGEA
jgi:hypothetical protein